MVSIASPEELPVASGLDWLTAQRQQFAARVEAAEWPSPETEIWRYSRISELNPSIFAYASAASSVDGPPSVLAGHDDTLARTGDDSLDVFSDMALAYANPTVIRIANGEIIAQPIVIHHTAPAGKVVYTWLVVEVGPNAEASVVEQFTGGGGLVVSLVELRVAQAGRLRYQSENLLSDDTWLITNQRAAADRDSTIRLGSASFGGHYSRVRTDVRLVGQGAHAEQVGLSFGEGSQMHDFRVSQTHAAPRTTSDLLFKSAVEGSARSVYTGMIHIDKNARGSTAFQTNRIVKLSEDAWAESVPNLDIENNDVKCSHASTVGPVDPEQRFYLESRGIPTSVADRLIVLGFFDDVITRLPIASSRAVLRQSVADKLDRRAAEVSV